MRSCGVWGFWRNRAEVLSSTRFCNREFRKSARKLPVSSLLKNLQLTGSISVSNAVSTCCFLKSRLPAWRTVHSPGSHLGCTTKAVWVRTPGKLEGSPFDSVENGPSPSSKRGGDSDLAGWWCHLENEWKENWCQKHSLLKTACRSTIFPLMNHWRLIEHFSFSSVSKITSRRRDERRGIATSSRRMRNSASFKKC